MKKLIYILSLVVILMLSFLIKEANAKSIYDLIGKSYKGCEIVDVVIQSNEMNDHYLISCIKKENGEYKLVRYILYFSSRFIEDNLYMDDIVHLLKDK